MFVTSCDEFVKRLSGAVRARHPFSLVRVGDGEGIIIGYPEFTGEHDYDKRITKWSELQRPMSKRERICFAEQLRNAVRTADIVGTPTDGHMELDQNWRNTRRYLKFYSLIAHDECSMDLVLMAHLLNGWVEILAGVKDLYVISCRDLTARLRARFGVERVHQFPLPPQVKPAMGPVLAVGCHYPTLFNQVEGWVRKRAKGNVFLIGAGGFGKIYCSWVRAGGGVALDVGSLFDAWAGFPTRSYIRHNVGKWQL